jgi:hypothetical protein
MINDIVIIDNIFEDADDIVKYAKKQTFFSAETHPSKDSIEIYWVGNRTLQINDLDSNYYQKIINQMMYKVLKDLDYKTVYLDAQLYFHTLNQTDIFSENWIHKDTKCKMAGVVYLNDNPDKKCGTVIFKDDQKIEIENIYNRLVLYDSQYLHGALGGFGDNLNNNRLTITFFINELNISLV